MRFFVFCFLLLVACAGCQPTPPTDAQLRKKLHSITVADGISQSEAQIIVDCYFAQNIGCGAFEGIHDGGDRWIVDGRFGYAGTPVKNFYIDKLSGKVVSSVGPSYDDPLKIFP